MPINAATRTIVGALMSERRFRRAYLGIALGPRPLPPAAGQQLGRASAVEIVETVEGSPADAAGLRPEDLILEVDGLAVESVNALSVTWSAT